LYSDTNAGYLGTENNFPVIIQQNNTERMRIDSSGNLLVGKTSSNVATAGHELLDYGRAIHTVNASTVQVINRLSNNGDITIFQKDGSTVGSIGIQGTGFYIDGEAEHAGIRFGGSAVVPRHNSADSNNYVDLGASSARFKDLYLSGGIVGNSNSITISTDSGTTDHVTVDTSGNLLVGKTSTSLADAGARILPTGQVYSTASGAAPFAANRLSSDGAIMELYKDTGLVGSIGVEASDLIIDGTSNHSGFRFLGASVRPRYNGAGSDGAVDVGGSTQRFKDLYLSGGVYLGGTGSANKLDDYEEGTWTVTNAGDSTGTVSSNGRYVKIGRQVTCHATVSVTASFSSFNLGGLPFNPDQNSTLSSIHSAAVCVGGNVKMVSANHASGNLTARSADGNSVNPTGSQIIRFTIVYQTA
jgi:hypothetical protein